MPAIRLEVWKTYSTADKWRVRCKDFYLTEPAANLLWEWANWCLAERDCDPSLWYDAQVEVSVSRPADLTKVLQLKYDPSLDEQRNSGWYLGYHASAEAMTFSSKTIILCADGLYKFFAANDLSELDIETDLYLTMGQVTEEIERGDDNQD